jgi:NAD(P)-dependent dehydrogenase (short-subunit alcohol dehydrogenase family)
VSAAPTELAGRVAVVTGGSGSIGAATCRLFAGCRMRIAVVAGGKVIP